MLAITESRPATDDAAGRVLGANNRERGAVRKKRE
jgi:hypothetical protein